ncbi:MULTISPECIES: hypothetical protein [Oceanobacillus]
MGVLLEPQTLSNYQGKKANYRYSSGTLDAVK